LNFKTLLTVVAVFAVGLIIGQIIRSYRSKER
jgi:hypothetical protein